MNKLFLDYTHYVLEDGRVWDIAEAKFVPAVPEGEEWRKPFAEDGSYGVKGLEECLRFFKFPLGELKRDSDFAAEARGKRDALLAETDFMMLPDYPLSEAKRQALTVYRQALRDVPVQSGFPRQIDWPVKP